MKTKLILLSILFTFTSHILLSQIVLPWTEDFEGAVATTHTSDTDTISGLYDWSFDNTSSGRLRFNVGAGFYHSGSRAATLDVSSDGSTDTKMMTVELDLSLYRNSTDLELSFFYMDHGDVSDASDCIGIKVGSSSTEIIYSLNPGSKTNGVWYPVTIDLDAALSALGLYPDEETQIIFSNKCKYRTLTTTIQNGITFDDISITGSMPQVLLPWIEDFEGVKDNMTIGSNQTAINGRANISYQKTLNGRLRFNAGSGYCHSGSRAATFDCDVYNSSLPQNMMVMTMNMERYISYDDLELSFYYKHHGEAFHMWDKVYIRGSSSDAWVEAYDLFSNQALAGIWKEVNGIDIDALLTAQGQTVSSTFQIAFSQQDDNVASTPLMASGISIDDIIISCNDVYWLGKVDSDFTKANNFHPSSNPNSTDNVVILNSAERMPIVPWVVSTLQYNDFEIEAGAHFYMQQKMGQMGSAGNFRLIINGDFTLQGEFDAIYNNISNISLEVTGDFINLGGVYDTYVRCVIEGSNMSQISGTTTTEFGSLTINVSNTSFNAVELTCDTDSLICESLSILDGSLEFNTGGTIQVGNLTISEDACLNVNDLNANLVVQKSLININTSTSSTKGLYTSSSTNILFDLSDDGSGNLMFGNGTSSGSLIYDVTFNNSSSTNRAWTLQSDMLIQNYLYLTNGRIQADTNYVIVENTSTNAIQTHGENSYIDGNLRRYVTIGTYDLPVGTSSNYELAMIDLIAMNGAVIYLDANFTESSSETFPEGLEVNGSELTEFLDVGYWTITPNAGISVYNITLTSRGHTNGGYDPAQHTILKRSGVGDWESLGTHDNSTQSGSESAPISVTRSSLSGFSDFIIAKNGIPFSLPVKLVNLEANCNYNNVLLFWETASELNNDYFAIEKSTDGVNFYEIGSEFGCGTCNYYSNYEFIDEYQSNTQTYYRLKQIDFDGSYEYSETVTADCKMSQDMITFNLVDNHLVFSSNAMNAGKYSIQLFDVSGKLVQKNQIFVESNCEHKTNVSTLSTGVYFVRLSGENFELVDKLWIGR